MTNVPHRCPVCEGRGVVPMGFYSIFGASTYCSETCKACGGCGIIWAINLVPDALPLPAPNVVPLRPGDATYQAPPTPPNTWAMCG